MTPLELDGGDGGGQLLRTALSLSGRSGRAFEMTDIRAERPTTGLRPQHLACIETVQALTDADVDGATEGSERLGFEPRQRPQGAVTVETGTAGSIQLVFDTVLPLAATLDEPISITVTGGTDVKWAPTFDFFRRVKLPLLSRFGLAADVSLDSRGFYPVGGGRATLHLGPSTLRPITVETRGSLVASVHAVASTDLPDDVCDRALDRVRDRLSLPIAETTAIRAETASPGFALLVALSGETRAGFDALGERGIPAETVADGVVDRVESWLSGAGAVDAYLGDQLVVPLALAGGSVWVPRVTNHVRTAVDLLGGFGFDVALEAGDGARLTVR